MKHDLIYMLRHAKTKDNRDGVISSNDTLLDEDGEKQARELRPLFDTLFPHPEECYFVRSELPRAKQTANFMNPDIVWNVDPGLNEIDNGVLGGKITLAEAAKILADGKRMPKSVERHSRHAERVVLSTLDHVRQCPEHQTPVFLSHHLSMEHVAHALGMEGVKFKNATFYCFEREKQTGQWNISEVSLVGGEIKKTPLAGISRTFTRERIDSSANEIRI